MNDLIKDLATQSIVENISSDRWVFNDAELEKFAQLIVRECVDICESGSNTQTTCGGAAILIKQHFGVEE